MTQLGQTRRQLVQGYVCRSSNVSKRTVEFIGTTHVENQRAGVPRQAGRQIGRLDPFWRRWRAPEPAEERVHTEIFAANCKRHKVMVAAPPAKRHNWLDQPL